jgi:alkylation response protein AidB-like acyl-CoA dehydrogenase
MRSPRPRASRKPTRNTSKAAGRPELRPEFGGQGLPLVVNQCLYEMLNSANQAWTMYPGLTHGAYAALHAHGTDEQKPPTCTR